MYPDNDQDTLSLHQKEQTENGLSEGIGLLTTTGVLAATAAGRAAVGRLVQCKGHIGRASGGGGAAVHQLQFLVGDKAYVHFGDIPDGAILRLFHAGAAESHVKRAEQVQLHLVAVGKVGLYFLHKGFDDVLHVAFCHGAILLDIGGEDIDVHRTAGFGLLTEIIQLGASSCRSRFYGV